MSVDYYRRTVDRLRDDTARLESKAAAEQTDAAKETEASFRDQAALRPALHSQFDGPPHQQPKEIVNDWPRRCWANS